MSYNSEQTREILSKVRQVEIKTRRLVTDAMAGAYHSVFKGQGMDFEEVREYAIGDEVRSIDWNVTAKMDRPFVKKFKEERELTIMLLVDLSGSGFFGSASQSKRECAAELASVLAFSALKNNDKVGLLLFTDKVEKFIFPKKGRQHILRVIREILFFEPENKGTDIPGALSYFNRLQKKKSVTFLISDFLQDQSGRLPDSENHKDEALFQILNLTNRHHDLICIQLVDPRENELPDIGIIILEDSETGQQVEVNTSNPKVRSNYTKANQSRKEELIKAFRRSGVDVMTITTHKPYLPTLREFFKRRLSRR